jgi:WD40 repeat protein
MPSSIHAALIFSATLSQLILLGSTAIGEEFAGLAFADNGRVVLGLSSGELRAVQCPDLESVGSFRGPKPQDTAALATFADGSIVALASKSLPRIDLWDMQKKTLFRRIDLSEPASSISLSPDGTKLAVAGAFEIIVLEVETKKKLATLANSHQCPCLQWSPNGKLLGMVCENKVIVWFVNTNRILMNIPWPTAVTKVPQLAFSPDSRLFATRADHSTVIWDVAKAKEYATFADVSLSIPGLAWTNDGKQIITTTESEFVFRNLGTKPAADGTVEIEIDRKMPIDFKAGRVWFSSDAKYAIGHEYNFRNTDGLHAMELEPSTAVATVETTPSTTATAGMAISLGKAEKQLWREPKLVRFAGDRQPCMTKPTKSDNPEAPNAQNMCTSMDLSADGALAVVGGMEGEVFIGKMPKGNIVSRFRASNNDKIGCITISPNGKNVAVGGNSSHLDVWSDRGLPLARLSLDEQPVFSNYSPLGSFLVVATESTLYMFESVNYGLIQKLEFDGGYLRSLAFSPDEHWIAIGDLSSVWLWSLADDQIKWRVESGSAIVSGIAISPANKRIVVDYGSPVSELYDLESGNQLVLKDVMLESPAFLDEDRIIAGDGIRALQIVSANDLSLIQSLPHPSGGVNIEAYSNRLLLNSSGTAALFRGSTPFTMSDLRYWQSK